MKKKILAILIVLSTFLFVGFTFSSNDSSSYYEDRIAELEWQNEDLLDRVEELEAEVDELQVFMWDIQDGPYVGY